MADPRTALAAIAAGILLAAPPAGCGTDPEPQWQVVDMRHDPEEIWWTGAGPIRGTWDLVVCQEDTTGQPTDECRTVPVQEDTWRATQIGDRVDAPESGRPS